MAAFDALSKASALGKFGLLADFEKMTKSPWAYMISKLNFDSPASKLFDTLNRPSAIDLMMGRLKKT
jgi:hypothetical protein